MLNDPVFMRLVIGKKLTFRAFPTLGFSEENKIVAFACDFELAEAWLRLLGDPILVGRVLLQKRIEKCYILDDAVLKLPPRRKMRIEELLSNSGPEQP